MGVVYRATHLALEREVALKLIAPELAQDGAFRERFQRESRTAASIKHPNVVTVFHAGEDHGLLYITMNYVPGTDLRAMIARSGPLEPAVAVEVIRQVSMGLDVAHANGLVHRDVKPANILVEEAPQTHAYLTDFGVTRHLASSVGLTKTGDWVGTLDYVAPEQIKGELITARADVYSMGCVLVEALTGEVPFPRDTDVAKMYAHINEPPPSVAKRARLGPPWDLVIGQAMAKDPNDRFASAGDLGRAAVAVLQGKPTPKSQRDVASGPASSGIVPAGPVLPRASAEPPRPVPTPGAQTTTQPAASPSSDIPLSRFALWRSDLAAAIVDHKLVSVGAILLVVGAVVAVVLADPLNKSQSAASLLQASFPPKVFKASNCETRDPAGARIVEQVVCAPAGRPSAGAYRFYRYDSAQDKKVAYGQARRLAIQNSATPVRLNDCNREKSSSDGYWYRHPPNVVGGQALCYTTTEGISHLVVIYANSAVLMEGVGPDYSALWTWFHHNAAAEFSPPKASRSTG
jgi:serine/threonine protein kinase